MVRGEPPGSRRLGAVLVDDPTGHRLVGGGECACSLSHIGVGERHEQVGREARDGDDQPREHALLPRRQVGHHRAHDRRIELRLPAFGHGGCCRDASRYGHESGHRISTCRFVPQQRAQMDRPTAGQWRLAGLARHSWHCIGTACHSREEGSTRVPGDTPDTLPEASTPHRRDTPVCKLCVRAKLPAIPASKKATKEDGYRWHVDVPGKDLQIRGLCTSFACPAGHTRWPRERTSRTVGRRCRAAGHEVRFRVRFWLHVRRETPSVAFDLQHGTVLDCSPALGADAEGSVR